MPAHHSADYWVGNLAMAVAVASKDPDPKPILRSTLREFLAERPPGNELGDLLREAMRKGKT